MADSFNSFEKSVENVSNLGSSQAKKPVKAATKKGA
jgi:hypothetical protein